MSVFRLIILAVLCGLSACASLPPAPSRPAQPLVLVSIDGFRADYLQRGLSPNLKALADGGATAVMHPSFPSITFPNHYTMVTGKYPDHTGIVANTMLDAAQPDTVFKMSNDAAVTDRFWWDEATPLWVSAERAGKKAGVEFWPGSEAPVQGVRPSYYSKFDYGLSNDARVDQILAWMDLPLAERPAVYLLYFNTVDSAGHDFGPDSAEVNTAIAGADEAIGRLVAGIQARGLTPNLIVAADHGMSAISPDRAYFLEDYLPAGSYQAVVTGPEAMINATPGHEADLDRLTKMTWPHMACWHKADIPARYHFGKNPRVPVVLCLGDPGWLVADTHAKGMGYKGGAHGYDNLSPDMQALFLANGPDIRPGTVLKPFYNIDLYSLEAALLRIEPEPNDGNLRSLRPALLP